MMTGTRLRDSCIVTQSKTFNSVVSFSGDNELCEKC